LSEPNVPAAAIDRVPDEVAVLPDAQALSTEYQLVLSAYGGLQAQLEEVSAAYVALQGSSDAARAALIKPYAWAVLAFMSAYGSCMMGLLLLQGFHPWGFHIHDGVMGTLVGSSAVAAIGLVHTVVKGLFPSN
jgi:hypothetical protein